MHPTEQDGGARVAMIALAERLFAEQGIESVSMRQVAIGAGQRNNSAVSYHFGSREGLVRAVLKHRSGPTDARRYELIEQLESDHADGADGADGANRSRPTIDDITRIFVQPLAETMAGGEPTWYLRFLADATVDPSRDETQHGTPPPGVRWVNDWLAALIDAPTSVLRRRMRWMVLITLRVLADHERSVGNGAPHDPLDPAELDEIIEDLTRTLSALLVTQ